MLEQYETSLANKLDINAGDSVYYDCATSKDTTGQMFSMMMPLLLMMFFCTADVCLWHRSPLLGKRSGVP